MYFAENADRAGIHNSSILDFAENDSGDFGLRIPSMMKLYMCTSFFAQCQSFRQELQSVHMARVVDTNTDIAGLSKSTVLKSVQATISIILQLIRDFVMMKRTWAFSISFDGATNL